MKPVRSASPYFARQEIRGITADLQQILRSGRLILGPYLRRFEQEFAHYTGVRYAVGVSSCTAALEAVLRFLNIQGREVLVPTNTFVATVNAVIFAGGRPVFCDIEPDTLALDPEDMARRLRRSVKAVIAVHVGGTIAPSIERVQAMCRRRGIPLIEDASHAHGATFKGRKAGAFGFAGCFSLYPTKVMTTGCGGVVTTNSSPLAKFCAVIRHHGAGASSLRIPELQGNDWLMDEIGASLGRHQLSRLERHLAVRNRIAGFYRRELASVPGIRSLPVFAQARNSYYKYLAVIERRGVDLPRALLRASKRHGVEFAQLYFPPCHQQPIFRRWARGVRLPAAEDLLPRTVALPVHVGLTRRDVSRVVDAVRKLLEAIR